MPRLENSDHASASGTDYVNHCKSINTDNMVSTEHTICKYIYIYTHTPSRSNERIVNIKQFHSHSDQKSNSNGAMRGVSRCASAARAFENRRPACARD